MTILDAIPLETNDESILGAIKKTIVENERIYILDSKTKSLKVFSNNGKFLFNIGSWGQGPGEYKEIRDFCVNQSAKKIYILDFTAVLCYNIENGNFIEKISIDKAINPVRFYCDSSFFYFWEGNTQKGKPVLLQYKKDGKKRINKYLPYGNYIVENERFICNGDSCLVTPPNGDFFIYEICDNKFISKYLIDFGKLALPKSSVIDMKNCDEIDENLYFNQITDVRETDKWLYVLVVGPNAKYYQILIDKVSRQIISGRPNYLKDAFRIVYVKENVFYAIAESSHILSAQKNSIIYHLSDSIKEDDNPVLFKFKIE
jgi:hypothetical protein